MYMIIRSRETVDVLGNPQVLRETAATADGEQWWDDRREAEKVAGVWNATDPVWSYHVEEHRVI